MVVGKLLILSATSPALADVNNPRFFNYRSGDFINRLADFSFGYFKTLSPEDKAKHQQALSHAVMFSQNNEAVQWYGNRSSGFAVPVMTWPTGSGYCRRIHAQAIAYNVEKTMSVTACFNKTEQNWQWIDNK
jgi:surface antigen